MNTFFESQKAWKSNSKRVGEMTQWLRVSLLFPQVPISITARLSGLQSPYNQLQEDMTFLASESTCIYIHIIKNNKN